METVELGRRALCARRAARDFRRRIDSTNDEARRARRSGDPGPLWIVADAADQGPRPARPQLGSPPGNLYASLLLIGFAPPAIAPQLGFVAGVATDRRADRDHRRAASARAQMAERRAARRRQARRHAAGRLQPARRPRPSAASSASASIAPPRPTACPIRRAISRRLSGADDRRRAFRLPLGLIWTEQLAAVGAAAPDFRRCASTGSTHAAGLGGPIEARLRARNARRALRDHRPRRAPHYFSRRRTTRHRSRRHLLAGPGGAGPSRSDGHE